MSVLLWIGGALAAGFGLRKLFGASPVTSGSNATQTSVVGMFTIIGRPTYVHAPADATRLVIYFHGHGNNAATRGPRLAAALGGAKVALVIPQLGPKSEIDDLDVRMAAYIAAVRKVVGLASSPLDGISHSGGYRGLAALIRQTPVSGVALFDSLYGEYATFSTKPVACLIDIYGSETAKLSEELRATMPRYQILRTSTMHDAIPEKYIRQVVQALPSCTKVTVT